MDSLHSNIELEILACIVRGLYKDKDVLSKSEPGFFSVGSHKWLLEFLKKREWEPVAWEYLDAVLTETFEKDDEKRDLYRNQLYQLYVREITFQKDAEDKFKEFVAWSTVKAGIKDATDAYTRSSRFDYFLDEMKTSLMNAKRVVEGQPLKTSDWADGYKGRMDERVYNRMNPDTNPIIRTGIALLDEQVEVKGPIIFNFLAPFKGYKSIMLNSVGYAALLQGYNVLHVVLENSIELTETRYDALFNNITYSRLKAAVVTPDEKLDIDRRMEWIGSWASRLKIVKCIPKITKVSDIADQIDSYLGDGFIPDVLILDYANILAPSQNIRESNLQQEKIFWDIKGLVDHYNMPCFTATQANQEGNKAVRIEKKKEGAPQGRLNSSHQGKAIDISQAIDVTVGINQTIQEKEDNIVVLSIMLAREADIYCPEIILDSDVKRMTMSRDLHHLWKLAEKVHNI